MMKYENAKTCYFCMNAGIIDYYKRGLKPRTDCEYQFYARCPFCEAGKNYPFLISVLDVIDPEALEWRKHKNFEAYGHITAERVQRARCIVEMYLKS